MADSHIQIVYKAVNDLNPYKNNPRNNAQAVAPVAESIRQFGFKVPIVIDRYNVVVTGHTRLKAAKLLGMSEVPCIMADDLSDEQVNAFRLADNKVGEIATWDTELLSFELDKITDIDMSDFGFDLGEEVTDEHEIVEDDYDGAVPEETDIKPGDIFQLGRHRLICGDGTSETDLQLLMDGKQADMLLTDPPL